MSDRKPDLEKIRKGHAAQIDCLLAENARLREALEGQIDPSLFGANSVRVSPLRRLARRVVPGRFHPAIASFLKRTGR